VPTHSKNWQPALKRSERSAQFVLVQVQEPVPLTLEKLGGHNSKVGGHAKTFSGALRHKFHQFHLHPALNFVTPHFSNPSGTHACNYTKDDDAGM